MIVEDWSQGGGKLSRKLDNLERKKDFFQSPRSLCRSYPIFQCCCSSSFLAPSLSPSATTETDIIMIMRRIGFMARPFGGCEAPTPAANSTYKGWLIYPYIPPRKKKCVKAQEQTEKRLIDERIHFCLMLDKIYTLRINYFWFRYLL